MRMPPGQSGYQPGRPACARRNPSHDATTGLSAPQYANIGIEAPPATDSNGAWSAARMQWINTQLTKDGYDILLPHGWAPLRSIHAARSGGKHGLEERAIQEAS